MRQFSLENGVRVVLDQTGESNVAIAVMINSGSRNDPPGVPGLHHALEHMMARATISYPSWEELCGYTDEFCSAFNAETDKSKVVFFVKTESANVRSGLRVLDEIINRPAILSPAAAEHLSAEHGRLADERRQANDLTDELVDEQLDRLMLSGGLAHSIDGSVPVIKRYTLRRLRRLYTQAIVGRRMTIVATGGFNQKVVEASIRRVFRALPPGRSAKAIRGTSRQRQPIRLIDDPTREQIHFSVGFKIFGANHPNRYALCVLRNYLSQRSSSRIKVNIDSLGFGYSSSDFMTMHKDVGQYGLRVWLGPKKFIPALQRFSDQIGIARDSLISQAELLRAKRNIRIDTREQFSDPLYAAKFMADQIATQGTYVPVKKFLREINAVTRQQVRQVARKIFLQRRLYLVVAGPLAGVSKNEVREALRFRKRKSKPPQK